jgi:branched-chain amino acid transport system permease protein
MHSELQYFIDAVNLGGLYAMAALGIGLIFGVVRLINFAHGDFITLAGFSLIVPSVSATAVLAIGALPWPLVIVSASAVVAMIAALSEILVFRRLRGQDPATLMVASFALSFIIQHVIIVVYDSRPKMIGFWPQLNSYLVYGSLRVAVLQVVTIAITVAALASLTLFLKYTRFGLEMRAAAENFRMARMLGVRANGVILVAFILSAILATLVALVFVVQTGVLMWQLGGSLMMYGFIATVLGGLGSLLGATLGGFAVGFTSVLLQIVLPLSLRPARDAFLFTLLLLVLVARPGGLVRLRAQQQRV